MKTTRWHFIFLCHGVFLLSEVFSWGQIFFEDFEKSLHLYNWESNDLNRWEISSVGYLNGSFSLHHSYDNPSTGTDYIFRAYPFALNFYDTLSWQFIIKHGYLPSSANNWGFYLSADCIYGKDQCISSGILVGVNLTGSDDGLNLYQIKDKKIYPLTQSKFNWEEKIGTNAAKVKIVRNPTGLFQLWVTPQNQTLPILVEETYYEFIPSVCYFGIQYTYSSSQDRKIWFDDIQIISKPHKNMKFNLDTFYFTTPQQLVIQFNQPIDDSSITNNSISLSPSIDFNFNVLCNHLTINLLQPYNIDVSYTLKLHQISSKYNSKIDTAIAISQYRVNAFEIIFSEIMIDPTPSQKLPPYEYIECYNRSHKELILAEWKISNGNTTILLPTITINSGEYILLSMKNASKILDTYGKVFYCLTDNFLNNENGTLILYNEFDEIICYLNYKNTYIDDKTKRNGGWSLELIDLNHPCAEEKGWKSSRNPLGGTPGFMNSISGQLEVSSYPSINQVAIPNDSTVVIFFNMLLHPSSLTKENYWLNNMAHPYQTSFFQNQGNAIMLSFSEKLSYGEPQTLKVKSKICDCNKNFLKDTTLAVIMPTLPDSGDVVINEILFETDDTCSEFIEFYNLSNKIIDAGSLMIVKTDSITHEILAFSTPFPQGLILLPGGYLVSTPSVDLLKQRYYIPYPQAIMSWGKMFTFPNTEAIILLRTLSGQKLDKIYYSSNMHYALLNNTRGVSLERIRGEGSGMDRNNWHSASAISGYATPGYKNSQQIVKKEGISWLQLSNNIISPNNDGVDDILSISVSWPEPAQSLTLTLYTAEGRLLKHLAFQQYIGNTATILWDGTVNSLLLPPGIYIIYARLMNNKRILVESKKTITMIY